MYVIPGKGRSVPDPVRGDILPESGREVERNGYWLRRRAAGEVTIREDEIPQPAVKKGGKK